MKKLLSMTLTVLLLMTAAGADEGRSQGALDAFQALTGRQAQTVMGQTAAEYLAQIMAGSYDISALAAELPALSRVTVRDMAAWASTNKVSVAQVRNSYYRALAEAVKADMQITPVTDQAEGQARQVLSLFLNASAAEAADRQFIRAGMTEDAAEIIASSTGLPEDFVTFIIMDENWQDADWRNDSDWRLIYGWNDDDLTDHLAIGSRDSLSSTRVAELQERLIALGYLSGKADGIFGEKTQAALLQYQRANGLPATGTYDNTDDAWLYSGDAVARWDYMDTFDNTPDNTPDRKNSTGQSSTKNTRRDNTPDNTPDNTRDNTPDYDNT